MDKYEKLYNEALERAQKATRAGGDVAMDIIQYIFPELAESEDERIRKEIRDFLIDMECKKEWIAHLEKQSTEHKTYDGKALSRSYDLGYRKGVADAEKEMYEESGYTPDESRAYDHGYENGYDDGKGEAKQKPAEWSEEDENKIESIKGLITTGRFADTNTIRTIWDLLDSLRPSWKPSEEQEEC